jgi:hypothetical protein
MESKQVCTQCNMNYPLTSDYFYHNKNNPSGFNKRCKWCTHKLKPKDKLANDKKKTFVNTYATKSTRILLPVFMLDIIDKHAKRNKSSRSWIITEALIDYLNFPKTLLEDIREDDLQLIIKANNINKQSKNTIQYKIDNYSEDIPTQITYILKGIYPNYTTKKILADKLGVSEKTVQRNIQKLKDLQVVDIKYKGRGGQAEIRYASGLYNIL